MIFDRVEKDKAMIQREAEDVRVFSEDLVRAKVQPGYDRSSCFASWMFVLSPEWCQCPFQVIFPARGVSAFPLKSLFNVSHSEQRMKR